MQPELSGRSIAGGRPDMHRPEGTPSRRRSPLPMTSAARTHRQIRVVDGDVGGWASTSTRAAPPAAPRLAIGAGRAGPRRRRHRPRCEPAPAGATGALVAEDEEHRDYRPGIVRNGGWRLRLSTPDPSTALAMVKPRAPLDRRAERPVQAVGLPGDQPLVAWRCPSSELGKCTM